MQLNTLGVVHEFLRRTISEGSVCIDATAGRGRDTALLCRLAGASGRVLSFDIQESAIQQTKELLAREGWKAEVFLDSHANLEHYAEPESVDCVVFNLGRLPGGDPKIFTVEESTLPAIDAGLRLLKEGGIMAIALYYGGENGYGEQQAVLEHLRTLDDRTYSVLACDWANRRGDPPMPILIWKEHGSRKPPETGRRSK